MTLNLNKAFGLGIAILTLTAGSAFAASTSGGLTVYSGPSDTSAQAAVITGQQTFNVVKRSGGWCEIASPKAGWVSCAQLDGARTNFATPSLMAAPTVAPIYDPKSDNEVADRSNP